MNHADTLRKLGKDVLADLGSRRTVKFPGPALESEQLHLAFWAHFPQYAKKLDKWDKLATSWNEAMVAVGHVASEYAKANGFESGGDAFNNAAIANVNGIQPAAEPFTFAQLPDKTTTLLYGKYQITLLPNPTAQQIADREVQFQNLLGGVGTWREVQHAQTIRLQLDALSKELSTVAAKISMSHNLTVASTCPICPKS
jgi:hypothetical protein